VLAFLRRSAARVTDAVDIAYMELLASFARKEGVRNVAEHVEDAETARMLVEMGVDYGQGWHFGRPQLDRS